MLYLLHILLLQVAKQLHAEEGVPYADMAVLFRAFNSMGGKAHTHLQVCTYVLQVQFGVRCICIEVLRFLSGHSTAWGARHTRTCRYIHTHMWVHILQVAKG